MDTNRETMMEVDDTRNGRIAVEQQLYKTLCDQFAIKEKEIDNELEKGFDAGCLYTNGVCMVMRHFSEYLTLFVNEGFRQLHATGIGGSIPQNNWGAQKFLLSCMLRQIKIVKEEPTQSQIEALKSLMKERLCEYLLERYVKESKLEKFDGIIDIKNFLSSSFDLKLEKVETIFKTVFQSESFITVLTIADPESRRYKEVHTTFQDFDTVQKVMDLFIVIYQILGTQHGGEKVSLSTDFLMNMRLNLGDLEVEKYFAKLVEVTKAKHAFADKCLFNNIKSFLTIFGKFFMKVIGYFVYDLSELQLENEEPFWEWQPERLSSTCENRSLS